MTQATLLSSIVYQQKKTIKSNHQIFFQDAINIQKIPKDSIDLVVTSPPYWKIKDYGNENQIGFHDSLNDYMIKLIEIFKASVKALKPNGKLCINIGDQFLKAQKKPKRVYQIIPLHSMIINRLLIEMENELVYLGSINWLKVTTSNTSGGGKIMGSYPFPKSGYFFVNREYIAIFRKLGKKTRNENVDKNLKEYSRLTLEEWREYFKDSWKFAPAIQDSHVAMFPEELPKRLIRMYSFVGDTVLDPFLGSGTTILTAAKLGRNSLGYEIGFNTKDDSNWKKLIKKKIRIPEIEFRYPLTSNHEKNEIEYEDLLIKNNFIFHD